MTGARHPPPGSPTAGDPPRRQDTDPPRLAALPFPEVARAAREGAVAILPLGSTEAHGPHLPLETDTILACEIARRAGARLLAAGRRAVLAPVIPLAVTDFARPFAGTVTLGTATARGVLDASLTMLREAGFPLVVLANGHLEPAHLEVLDQAARAASTSGFRVVFPNYCRKPLALRLSEEFRSGACHAGRYETSLVLAARPDLVRMDLARRLPPLSIPLHRRIREGARDLRDCGAPRAYVGDPARATVAEGEELFSILAGFVVEAAAS